MVPDEFTVWIMNRFGDLFLVLDGGSVHLLDVGSGTLEQVAASRDEFIEKIDEPEHMSEWLLFPLIDRLLEAGRPLLPGECYSFARLPALGGEYTVENARIVPIEDHYEALGPIHEKLSDVANGDEEAFE